MSLRTEYDRWHERVVQEEPEQAEAPGPWYKLVRDELGSVKGLNILEVACGRGGFVCELSGRGARIIGCDFSGSALQIGKQRLRKVSTRNAARFVQGDAQNLPFANATFDCVVSCETIEHLPDQRSALREMWRVARPGGRLFLTTPNYANLMGLYDLYARFRHPKRKDDQPFDRRQWFLQIRKWVREAGWTILRGDGTVHQLPIIPGHNPVRLKFLEASRMVRRALSPIAYTYFLLCEKRGSA